jgi:3-deoxy-manno-octulosonate cytidylyltransferase (CMP-KDO synthetase)
VRTAIVIPARFASQRLPGKPLLRETGKYLIQHVYERARQTSAQIVLVATDDRRIADAVASFGGDVVMTRGDHASGTDRVAEVARSLDSDVIVNLQGDEPMIDPATLDLLPDLLRDNPNVEMATLATPIQSAEQWTNPNCVKVVCDMAGNALYFSRSPVPYVRQGQPDFDARPSRFLQHLGLYAFRRTFLLNLAQLPSQPLEEIEKLEQLRVLALGHKIRVKVVPHPSIGIDTQEDYAHFVEQHRRQAHSRAA